MPYTNSTRYSERKAASDGVPESRRRATDVQRARRVASELRAGRVVINGMMDDPQAPWGGFKYSGVGREYGRNGIEVFLEPRAILES